MKVKGLEKEHFEPDEHVHLRMMGMCLVGVGTLVLEIPMYAVPYRPPFVSP